MPVPDLHCHSTFSTYDGMGSPDAVVNRAVELGWGAACLTEHGWMGSAPSFYKACIEKNVKPILGCEMYVIPDREEMKGQAYHLTVLALSAEGYFNLVAWTTFANQRENFYHKPRISIQEMIEIAPHPLRHNVILTGCIGGELAACLLSENGHGHGMGVAAGRAYVEGLSAVFDHVYLEFQNHEHPKRMGRGLTAYEDMVAREKIFQKGLAKIAKASGLPCVVTNDSHFQTVEQRKAHLAMRAGTWRQRSDDHFGTSKERLVANFIPDYVYWLSYMRPMEAIADGLPEAVREKALDGVSEIVEEANIVLDPLSNFNYSIPFSGYDDPVSKIRARARRRLEKLARRHGKSIVEARFEHELGAMGEFAHYLLLMSDFIIGARRQGILTNTRGSAANSLVCYCLKIHDVDPIQYKLTFERFYNPARKDVPDIDIDIEKDRYEDFMQIVIEHMNELEGEGQVVPISQYGTVANRSAFRLIAETLGMDKDQIDEIADLLPQMIDSGMVDEESDVYESIKEDYPEIYELASGVFDAIKSVGSHPCGWVFGTHERPIEQWIPRFLIASSNTMVSAYDLKGVKKIGLVKGDFLRLRTLSHVKRTLALVGKDVLDLRKIPLDDPDTFEMLREGKTEGVFTLQGKTNRQGCMEVEVADVHDVIATVAIYRPALTRPGFHKVYNDRRRGIEIVDYPHPIVEETLAETYGMPIFQEQIFQIGYAVGLTHSEVGDLYEAVKLAKGIGKGAKEAFQKIKPVFYKRALKLMTKEEADGIWNIFSTYQGYGFNRGHATSYGILAVRSAYLRRHYPREFFAALLDVYPEKHRYIAAARGEGFRFAKPDINRSGFGFGLGQSEDEILVGLSRIKGLGPVAVRAIVDGQPFASFADFKERVPGRACNKTKIESLASLGAFASIGVKGDADDLFEFQALGFTLHKPEAFAGCKPRGHQRRDGERWTHDGRTKGVEYTEPRHSVSKMFWIPPLTKKELYEIKTSPWAQVKTHLLLVVDENGIPFQLTVDDSKEGSVTILEFLRDKCRGAVVCCDGAIKKPFDTDGPMGFRFYSLTGSYKDDTQIWHKSNTHKLALDELQRRARVLNRRAA